MCSPVSFSMCKTYFGIDYSPGGLPNFFFDYMVCLPILEIDMLFHDSSIQNETPNGLLAKLSPVKRFF